MESGIVVRNDSVWQGHPDVSLFNGKIFVVYRESDRHTTEGKTRICLICSEDGKNFSNPIIVAETNDRYNCPRLSIINDELIIICDNIKASKTYIETENSEDQTRVEIIRSSDGGNWDTPIITNITGIVPDRICTTFDGQFLIATHTKDYVGNRDLSFDPLIRQITIKILGTLVQNIWKSETFKGPWEPFRLSQDANLNLCEASVFKYKNKYVALMRENSGTGHPAYMSISPNGTKWGNIKPTRMTGCHRPVCGILRSGNLLTTYREATYGFRQGYWAKNTFACLTSPKSILDGCTKSVILPLDHDSSQISDSGYTGWVQLLDDSIYIVNYITHDAPRPYIKWYKIREKDF